MKIFQIYEDDLASLEQILPELVIRMGEKADDNATRVKIRRLQAIMTNVRWNYSPHTGIEEIKDEG